jgi:DNA-directed RNA polymerase specialized sigma24 family protein
MQYMESIFTEPSKESLEKIEKVKKIMDILPPLEADFIDMYYFKNIKQTSIARIFSVSQPTVCYRLQRASFRIRFFLDLPTVTKEEIEVSMKGFLSDPLDVKIMVYMYDTMCQSKVAKILGVTQGLVRHRFLRSIKRMQDVPSLEKYHTLFYLISKNLNTLRDLTIASGRYETLHVIQ